MPNPQKMQELLAGPWSRRAWLTGTTRAAVHTAAFGMAAPHIRQTWSRTAHQHAGVDAETQARVAVQAACVDPAPLYALAERAVDAARSAGASYADVRLTRTVVHQYSMYESGYFQADEELVGVGVRALVNGCWGFAASPRWDADEVTRLATDAVEQAKANALGEPRRVELGQIPVVTGTWVTPIKIDPFTVPIEEKLDYIVYWKGCANQAGIPYSNGGQTSSFSLVRQERILVTSEGTRVTQTRYESGGRMQLQPTDGTPGQIEVRGIETTAKGWELFLDADLPEQFPKLLDELRLRVKLKASPATVGRYTLVCDGATMASMLDATLGVATQLDRALGFEANASGTSYLDDPLTMVGHFQAASPVITVTANRSAPSQLATVKWDDEGIEPLPFTLVKNGILTDFQTTREQASWLAPYYKTVGRPVRSNGCAAAEDALAITLQHTPNLALVPSESQANVDTMVATVKDGLLIEGGRARSDFQGRNGLILLRGANVRKITNGRLGNVIQGGGVYFNSLDFWKHVTAVGDAMTQQVLPVSQFGWGPVLNEKGEPAQRVSHSVQAPAALIANQPVIDPTKTA